MAADVAFVPRRGRPNSQQVKAIERAILASARRLFFAEGFDAVAMERIASDAGVSKGTLYTRYASKEMLFTALVEASVGEWSEASGREDHLLTDDIAQRLRHHARIIASSLVAPDVRAFQRILLANRDRFPALSRAMHNTGYRYIVDLIIRDIRAAAARDRRPVRDAAGVAEMMVSAITGWYLQELGHHELSRDEIEAFALRAVELVIAARDAW